jgi:UDPglucose 6-dehydrogenase
MARVAVIGLGYVGLTTAVGLGKLGHKVLGLDIDTSKVVALVSGKSPIFENGLENALEELIATESLKFAYQLKAIVDFGPEFTFICVATPQDASGAADLSILNSVANQISPGVPTGSILVVKSTVPVGTGQSLVDSVDRKDIFIASNPEFLREGTALKDFMEPDRIVVGSNSLEASSRVLSLYAAMDAPKVQTSLESAELIKYAANAYLAMRLSFTNDLAALAEKANANVDQVLTSMGLDSRIGSSFLKPGPGWGGSCFPKDTSALLAIANKLGSPLPLVEAAVSSNQAALARVIDALTDLVGGDLTNKIVAVWGVAFKAHTDDIRDSPAVNIITALLKKGALVQAFDPVAVAPELKGLTHAASALESVSGADVLTVLTEWPEFAEVSPEAVVKAMRFPAVFDARRILPTSWRPHFSAFRAIGESSK